MRLKPAPLVVFLGAVLSGGAAGAGEEGADIEQHWLCRVSASGSRPVSGPSHTRGPVLRGTKPTSPAGQSSWAVSRRWDYPSRQSRVSRHSRDGPDVLR
jgi:hypothetical protein